MLIQLFKAVLLEVRYHTSATNHISRFDCYLVNTIRSDICSPRFVCHKRCITVVPNILIVGIKAIYGDD